MSWIFFFNFGFVLIWIFFCFCDSNNILQLARVLEIMSLSDEMLPQRAKIKCCGETEDLLYLQGALQYKEKSNESFQPTSIKFYDILLSRLDYVFVFSFKKCQVILKILMNFFSWWF